MNVLFGGYASDPAAGAKGPLAEPGFASGILFGGLIICAVGLAGMKFAPLLLEEQRLSSSFDGMTIA